MKAIELKVAKIINNIETANTFNEMGDWTIKLNEMGMLEEERCKLFYEIDFPFSAKAEFFNGTIHIQEYLLLEE